MPGAVDLDPGGDGRAACRCSLPLGGDAAVPGADRYHVTLFDAGGRVRYESQLADTVATLPDSVALVPGQPYLWSVEARIGWDRWTTSPLTAFSVVPAPRR